MTRRAPGMPYFVVLVWIENQDRLLERIVYPDEPLWDMGRAAMAKPFRGHWAPPHQRYELRCTGHAFEQAPHGEWPLLGLNIDLELFEANPKRAEYQVTEAAVLMQQAALRRDKEQSDSQA